MERISSNTSILSHVSAPETGVDASKQVNKARKAFGTRKRAAMFSSMLGQLMSETLAFWGVRDNTTKRASADARPLNVHKLAKQVATMVTGKERKPDELYALHHLLGELATIKYGATPEQNARPYRDTYFIDGAREKLLLVNQRLDVLAGADSLFETMNETNRQDVKGVMAELKTYAMQALARQGIGEPLSMLADRLSVPAPDFVGVVKAWFGLEQGIYDAMNEGLDPVAYVQAGLESLPLRATFVFAAVLSLSVPPHFRRAREILDQVISDTPRDTPASAAFDCLDVTTVREGVRARISAYLDIHNTDMARKLENAVRPGTRTQEVCNLAVREMNRKVWNIGAVYVMNYEQQLAW